MKKFLLAAAVVSLSLGMSAQNTILTEDFQSGSIPADWSLIKAAESDGWKAGSATSLSSQFWTIPAHTTIAAVNDDDCDCDMMDDKLATPYLDLHGLSAAVIRADIFYQNGTDQGITEEAYIQVTLDSGATWTTIYTLEGEEDWRTQSFDLSAYTDTVIRVAFAFSDQGGWLFGLAIDDVEVYEPLDHDVAVNSITSQEYAVLEPITINGALSNLGAETVTELQLSYDINGANAVSETFSGLSIDALAEYDYSFAGQWTPSASGTYDIRVWVDSINGNVDSNKVNDTATFTVTIADSLKQRRPVVEVFTSSTCPPCATWNPIIKNATDPLNPNTETGEVTMIKYQQNYPSPGTDPAYTIEAQGRHDYYGVTGIPHLAHDGSYFSDFPGGWNSAALLPERRATWSLIDISGTATYSGNKYYYPELNVHVDVDPYYNVNSFNLKLHVVVVENFIFHQIQTNGETEFHQVMRKMLPNQSGTTIVGSLAPGSVKSFDVSHAFDSTELFVNWENTTVIAFVQDNSTQEILQSSILPIVNEQNLGLAENQVAHSMITYPNPSNGLINVMFRTEEQENVSINVYNVLGEMVYEENLGVQPAGTVQSNIDLTEMNSGIYFVNATVGETIISRKVTLK